MPVTTYSGLTRCPYESWEKCKIENPNANVQVATHFLRCMWLDETEKDTFCTNKTIQEKLTKERKDKRLE